jgi:MYXO-CTERM domain-containing protein
LRDARVVATLARVKDLRVALALAALLVGLSVGARARADIPPPNICGGGAGSACKNAGPREDQPGVCVATTCSRVHPGPNGLQRSDYPCLLCEGKDAAPAASASATATPTPTPTDGPPVAPPVPPAGCRGCEVGGAPAGRTVGFALAVALGALAARRRRSRPS